MSIPTRKRPLGLIVGLALIGLLFAVAVLSLVWTPASPTKMQILLKLKPPLVAGLLGTDQYGRDIASLLMVGAWNSLSIAFLSVLIGSGIGTALGLACAIRREGVFATLVLRGCDVLFAIPPILSAMMLGAFIGPGRFTAIIAIAVFMIPVFTRIAFAAASRIWARDYVMAARACGKGAARISIEHVAPNIATPILVQVTIQLGLAILTEAGLSFLGLGLPPPAPTWGRMLAEAQTFLRPAPWLSLLPGLAIAVSVLGFNLIGDGLRDLLDPKAEAGR